MTKVFEKMERIEYLMKELNNEISSLPTYEKELSADLVELDKETNDILHIIENIKLSTDESAELVSRMHELRDERRQAKALLCLITPLKHATKNLNRELVSKIEEVSIFQMHNSPGHTYTFRTKKGFDLMQNIIKNFDERSRVNVKAPGSFERKTVIAESVAKQEPVVSIVPTMNTAPVQELGLKPESSIHYMIIKDGGEWKLNSGLETIIQDKELEAIVNILFEIGWKTIRTRASHSRELKKTIRDLKKLETDTTRFQLYSKVQQHLA